MYFYFWGSKFIFIFGAVVFFIFGAVDFLKLSFFISVSLLANISSILLLFPHLTSFCVFESIF